MRVLRSTTAIAVTVILAAGCMRTSAAVPPLYPHLGFGRVGCYAGPSLAANGRDSSGALSPRTLARGPWLVLDSLDAAELARFPEEAQRLGVRVFVRDSLIRHTVSWTRLGSDSILAHESAFFASIDWRLRVHPDSLVGSAMLPHDVFQIVDGARVQQVSRWSVRAWRVPCSAVPVG